MKSSRSPYPLRVGLTGGIAAGKSEVQRILAERGVPVLDTDRVAHEVMAKGSPVHRAVVEHFGPGILGADGGIDRSVLGKIVFADPAEREVLNQLVHPETGRRWRAWLREQTGPLAVVAIPLLFECGLEKEFDGVLCVWAPEEILIKRLFSRGLDGGQARQRIRSQWSVERKKERATWILNNDGNLDELQRQVESWLQSLPNLE